MGFLSVQMSDDESFCDRLKDVVKQNGGNQRVAEKSGIPLGTLNNYLRGVSDPTVSKLKAIADSCGVSVCWLLVGELAESSENRTALDQRRIAWNVAYFLAQQSDRIRVDPTEFADTFVELMDHLNGAPEDQDFLNVVDFAARRLQRSSS